MDLFAKTIIVPSNIILNNEYLPHNLKSTIIQRAGEWWSWECTVIVKMPDCDILEIYIPWKFEHNVCMVSD